MQRFELQKVEVSLPSGRRQLLYCEEEDVADRMLVAVTGPEDVFFTDLDIEKIALTHLHLRHPREETLVKFTLVTSN